MAAITARTPASPSVDQLPGITRFDVEHITRALGRPLAAIDPDKGLFANLEDEIEELHAEREAELAHAARTQGPIPVVRERKVDPETGRVVGHGRRKTALAAVWLVPGRGVWLVNNRPHVDYFRLDRDREAILAPFEATNTLGCFDMHVRVQGGGISGQSQAIALGAARALQSWDPSYRYWLKSAGLLRRDPRMVERKKPGQPKARKKFQWVKR